MAKSSQGTTIQLGDGAGPEVFTGIGEVLDFSTPDQQPSKIDTTSHSSSSVTEFMLGLIDPGEMTFEVQWDPAETQKAALQTAKVAKTLKNFKVVDPQSKGVSFSAYVAGIGRSYPVNGKQTAQITLFLTTTLTVIP